MGGEEGGGGGGRMADLSFMTLHTYYAYRLRKDCRTLSPPLLSGIFSIISAAACSYLQSR